MPSSTEPLATPGGRPLLLAGPSDRYFDYCLQPYSPRRSPEGKLRGENLFWHSLDLAGAPPALDEAVRAIQRAAGRDLTVFGVKHAAGRLWWELYFYEADQGVGALRPAQLAAAVAPWFTVEARLLDRAPFFMWSCDLHPDTPARGRVDTLNYYLPYHRVQGGRSYQATADRVELENVYRFYHPKREIHDLLHDLRASVFVDWSVVPLQRVLLPELLACNRVCVAKKRHADALYYSGIDVDQLLFFLRRLAWPRATVELVERQRGALDHLRFDVGIDFHMDAGGRLVTDKSSCYGTL
jgi:hypothetical protein